MQFIGTMMTMIGAGIFLLAINFRLGIATLVPGLMILIFTKATSKWVKKKCCEHENNGWVELGDSGEPE